MFFFLSEGILDLERILQVILSNLFFFLIMQEIFVLQEQHIIVFYFLEHFVNGHLLLVELPRWLSGKRICLPIQEIQEPWA